MKIEKNKIVFGSVLAVIFIFLIAYTFMVISDDGTEDNNLKQTLVPELEQEQEDYSSKLDAINDLKEVKETNAPSIYDEKLIDSAGYYDPDLPEKEKERIVDSIYNSGRIKYSPTYYRNIGKEKVEVAEKPKIDSTDLENERKTEAKERGLEHKLFFASWPIENDIVNNSQTDATIYAKVDGNQVVKVNHRLRMRLTEQAIITGVVVPKNTPIYGFIKFQPNRALIEIENINHHPTKLKAFDLQDGSEGIYVENNFREELSKELLDDILGDINIPSVPQVSGISKVFRRNNRNVKITIVNNYKLILKPQL